MLTDPLTSFYFQTSLGMNNRMNELDFNGKYVLLAQNCRFQQMPGSVIKRSPLAYYNPISMSTTQGVVGSYRFYSFYGPLLIATCGSSVYVGSDSTGAMTPIASLSNANKPMMFVTYNSLLIGSNGFDPIFVYDGNPSAPVTWQLGSCQALIAGSGTGITATNISYAVTMDADAYINGSISNVIASASNQAINLAYIPLGPVGTTNRKIYRKDSNTGGNYRLVTTISDNSTTTYTDTTASASLGAGMPTITDPIPVGAWILIFAERLFITADPNHLNRIYYSEPFLPGYIQVNTNLDYLDVAKDDGDQIQGIAVEMGTMICIKQNNMRKLNITTAQSNVDPSTWSAEEPFSYVGTPARYSICQTQYGIVVLSWDFWYMVSGLQPKPIIPQFDTTQILPASYPNVVASYNDGMLFASYTSTSSGDQFPTQVLVYDFKLDQMSIDTYSAGSFASATGVNESGGLFIGDATQGFVYEISKGDIFYTLSNLSQAQQGTGTNIFIGGTQNNAFIQIGTSVSPSAIPVGICIFWDDTVNLPGSGWTEITNHPYAFPVISTISGLVGGSSSHTHSLSGTTSAVIGPLGGMVGSPNFNTGEGSAHTHNASGNTDPMFAAPNYFGLRIFYKNSNTTEYQFPVGSILMWDQPNAPDNWIPYSQSSSGYLQLIDPVASAPNWLAGTVYSVGNTVTATNPFTGLSSIYYCQIAHTAGAYDNAFDSIYGTNAGTSATVPSSFPAGAGDTYPISPVTFADDLAAGYWLLQYSNLGITIQSSHSHPYGVITPFQLSTETQIIAAPPGVFSTGSGFQGVLFPHTHYILGTTNATNTGVGVSWDLDRIEINFIKKLLAGETPWDGTSKNIYALFWDISTPVAPSNGWTEAYPNLLEWSSTTSYVPGNLVIF